MKCVPSIGVTIEQFIPVMDNENKSDKAEPNTTKDDSVDLSALENFDFGTSWSPTPKPSRGGARPGGRGGDRRGGPGGDRKERRQFKPGNFRRDDKSGSGGNKPDGASGARPARKFARRSNAPVRVEPPKKVVELAFYPEDNGFKVLCKALRTSCITYELFEIARIILQKEDRFYIIIKPLGEKGEADEEASFYITESDGMPFMSEKAALNAALANCLDNYFTSETVEVEAPKGSFPMIHKCGMTGELLGPPNYHKYKQLVAAHHGSRLANVPFAKFESRLEAVKEEEVIAEWLEKMKTATKYTLKPEYGESREFEDAQAARDYAFAQLSSKLVRNVKSAKLTGSQLGQISDRLIKANVDFNLDRQKHFPLDTANLLRGRLRRQKFALYKKGTKGVSYVCAVKRNFRNPDQVFADNVSKLLTFLETKPKVKFKELPEGYLGFATHGAEGEAAPELTDEQEKRVKTLSIDFQWLLKEGYISEFADGSVTANPIKVLSKKEIEAASKPKEAVKPKETAKPKATEVKAEETPKAETEAIPVATEEAKAEEPTPEAVDGTPEPVVAEEATPAAVVTPEAVVEEVSEKVEEAPVVETEEAKAVEPVVVAEEAAPVEVVTPEAVVEAVPEKVEEAPVESADPVTTEVKDEESPVEETPSSESEEEAKPKV